MAEKIAVEEGDYVEFAFPHKLEEVRSGERNPMRGRVRRVTSTRVVITCMNFRRTSVPHDCILKASKEAFRG